MPHLASHILALAVRPVVVDWEAFYGLRPWLAETLVDPQRFSGVCYRAASWIELGVTTGRGRQDRKHRRYQAHLPLSAALRRPTGLGFPASVVALIFGRRGPIMQPVKTEGASA